MKYNTIIRVTAANCISKWWNGETNTRSKIVARSQDGITAGELIVDNEHPFVVPSLHVIIIR